MITLYESILSDMDDVLSSGDNTIDDIAINSAGSQFRMMFPTIAEKPFEIIKKNGNKIFRVNKNRRTSDWVYADSGYAISDVIKDVDTVEIEGTATIVCDENISKVLAKNIVSDRINIYKCKEFKDTNLIINNLNVSRFFASIVTFSKDLKCISNCNIETKNSDNLFKLVFSSLPELKNVSSNSINEIVITPSTIVFGDNKNLSNDIDSNTKLTNLFDFGYKVTYSDDAGDLVFNIRNFKDIRKLIINHSKIAKYDIWPIKIKSNAKLTNFLDVSKFSNLDKIHINDLKIGILFIKSNSKELPRVINTFKYNMLCKSHYTDLNINDIPETADGWKVIIYKIY